MRRTRATQLPTPAARDSPSTTHAAPPVRGQERAARRFQGLQLRWHLEERATSARPLRRANSAGRLPAGSREEAALQVHLAPRACPCAHLDGALQLALKLGAAAPEKASEDDHVVDDALLHLLRPQLQVGVARKAPRCPGSCRASTAPHVALHTSTPSWESSMDMNFPP